MEIDFRNISKQPLFLQLHARRAVPYVSPQHPERKQDPGEAEAETCNNICSKMIV